MKIQGIRKHHDLEASLCRLVKNKKEFLEDIINMTIINLHIEVWINRKRVDLVGQLEDGSLLLIELLIRDETYNDFEEHRKQIFKILEIVGKTKYVQIILISPQFLNDDIKEIEKFISTYNAEIHFVKISRKLIFNMKYASEDNNKFIEYKNSDINKVITIVSKSLNRKNLFVFQLDSENKGNEISKRILQGLREKLYWHNSIHRYKNLKCSVIRIGSGVADIMFNIYCNKKDYVKVEVDFANKKEEFNVFKSHMADMSNKISCPLYISNRKAAIYSDIIIDKTVVDTTIKVAKEYIEYVSEMFLY